MVFNGDSYCDIKPKELLAWHFENNSLILAHQTRIKKMKHFLCDNNRIRSDEKLNIYSEDQQNYGLQMKPEEFKRLQSSMAPIFRRNEVSKAVLFGSAVRDTETKKSDIDLMIVMETDKRFFDRYDAFDEISEIVRGTPIDLLIYTPQELENISHRPFIRKILSEGKTIYEH